MLHFTHNDWHGWESNGQFLLSDEKVKHLRYFQDATTAMAWLYLEGYRDAARALNKAYKS